MTQLSLFKKEKIDYGDCSTGFTRHLEDCLEGFTKIIVLNLIEKTGPKGYLGQLYEDMCAKTDLPVDYRWANFNNSNKYLERAKMSVLMGTFGLDQELIPQCYAQWSKTGTLLRGQRVSYRTNCIDSNDRTNLMQFVLNQTFLRSVCKTEGITTDISRKRNFRALSYKIGVTLSLGSTSTLPMRGSVIKKEYSSEGKIEDIVTKMKRFYFINFREGYQIDCQDVFLRRLKADNSQNLGTRQYFFVFYYFVLLLLAFLLCSFAVKPLSFTGIVLVAVTFKLISNASSRALAETIVVQPTLPDYN